MTLREALSWETFRQMAAALGLEDDNAHLQALCPQVQALWRDLGTLDAVAASDVEPEVIFRLAKE